MWQVLLFPIEEVRMILPAEPKEVERNLDCIRSGDGRGAYIKDFAAAS